MAWAGAGVFLRTDRPGPNQLRTAVRRVLGDPSFRAGARRLQRAYARYDGPARAAEVILDAVAGVRT